MEIDKLAVGKRHKGTSLGGFDMVAMDCFVASLLAMTIYFNRFVAIIN
jgi:hypothetical protein